MLRLALAHDPINDRALNPQEKVLKVHISPPQASQFSTT
jgi:hypothetical protein